MDRLDWDRDGRDWPNRDASRFVDAAGLTWHVQTLGQGFPILLIHGTGASTHSWSKVMPLLAQSHKVIAIDIPGHGFTTMPEPQRFSLPGMAAALTELMRTLDITPVVVVGHSAGAAIAIRMIIDGSIAPRSIVSINGALLPFDSLMGLFFSPVAKLLVSAPGLAHIAAWRGKNRGAVEGVIAGTGSPLFAEDIDCYARLFGSPGHVAAALAMMANWDLQSFVADLRGLQTALMLVTARNDLAIPPSDAEKIRELVSHAEIVHLPKGGHLVHEENPATIADIIFCAAECTRQSSQPAHSMTRNN